MTARVLQLVRPGLLITRGGFIGSTVSHGGKHKEKQCERRFRLRAAMGSLNPHYFTHIKVCEHTAHTQEPSVH